MKSASNEILANTKPIPKKKEWEKAAEEARASVLKVREEAPNTGGASSSAGAARPAGDTGVLSLEQGKQLWEKMCTDVFTNPGMFEPQQHVSIVCGRPTVVIWEYQIKKETGPNFK